MRTSLVVFATFFITSLFAGTDPDSTLLQKSAFINYVSLQYEQGGILPGGSTKKQALLDRLDYRGLRIKAGKQFKDSIYSKIYNMPVYGIGVFASTFNSDFVGKPIGIFGFFEYPVIRSKRLDINFELDFGIAGNFNPFNRERNPENLLIGSWLNKFAGLGFRANYAINNNYSIGVGSSIKHFSNGSSQKPNLGINLAPLELSVIYHGKGSSRETKKETIPPFKKRSLIDIYSAWGIKQLEIGGKKYTKSSLCLAYLYQNTYKTRWGLATEVFYATSGSDFNKSISVALAPTFDWVFSEKLFTRWSVGIYAQRHKENDERKFFYQNIALRYNCFNNFNVGFGLKAHLGVADYFSGIVGYTFAKTKRE